MEFSEYVKRLKKISVSDIKEIIDEKLHLYDDKLRTVITFDIDYTGDK